jgi:hypothetical protein
VRTSAKPRRQQHQHQCEAHRVSRPRDLRHGMDRVSHCVVASSTAKHRTVHIIATIAPRRERPVSGNHGWHTPQRACAATK